MIRKVSSTPIITCRNYEKKNRLVTTQFFIPLVLFNKYFRNILEVEGARKTYIRTKAANSHSSGNSVTV
jgi:hypothetical protein